MVAKTHTVRAPLYGTRITFVLGFDTAAEYGLEPEPQWGAMVGVAYGRVFFVLGDMGMFDTDTLPHESVHAAWRVLDLAGVEVESGNHEALAYLVGWINARAVRFYSKHVPAEE